MRHALATITTLLILALAPVAASAQTCPEGSTASGACVKPGLAKLMRWQTILMTQPKLSYTAPLFMPGDKNVIQPLRPIFEANTLSQPVPRGGPPPRR